jgi:hypothetical protein
VPRLVEVVSSKKLTVPAVTGEPSAVTVTAAVNVTG